MLMQLSNWRWSWRAMIVTGMCAPLLSIAAFGTFARGSGREPLVYVLSGSVVLSLMFENQNKVAQNFAFMKTVGTLDFLATLPIRRMVVVLATVLAFFVLSVPALLVTILVGGLVLGVHLSVSPLVVLVLPLCVLPMAGIGAVVGILARTPEESSSYTLLISLLLLGLGPVLVPPARLPSWLVVAGHLSPTTYAASAIRQVLVGPVNNTLLADIAVLIALTGATLWFAGTKMQWNVQR